MTNQLNLFGGQIDDITAQMQPILEQIARLPLSEQVETLNRVRQMLHQVGPFKDEPADCVQWIPSERVHSNDYNPNSVAPPEMRLLERSMKKDGITQPVVGWQVDDQVEIVDGFHRTLVIQKRPHIRRRVHGYVPVALINIGSSGRRDRMAATIRHNRARGVHGVMPMTDIVSEMLRLGCADTEVAEELGMDADELLRFKHNTGMAELFQSVEYSRAWE